MQYFSQLDPRWSHLKLGSSALTIGRWGCAFTSLINLYMGLTKKVVTPKQYMAMAQNPKNFTKAGHPSGAGLVLWEEVCKDLGGIRFIGRGGAQASKILTTIGKVKNQGVVVAVNKDSHFVTGWGVPKDGSDIIILDPLGAKKTSVLKANYKLSSARYFEID